MVTKTISHKATDSLNASLNGFRDADRKFKQGNAYKKIKQSVGLIGTITATEVTYGSNGWHPHTHEIWITESPLSGSDLCLLMGKVLPRWIRSCLSAGLSAPNHRGITIQDGTYASAYASKWGLSEELTKGHSKQGRKGSYTPFELLNVCLTSDDEKAVQVASSLFHEYATEFKGKVQLRFSPGLKDRYQVQTPTDEELATATDPDAEPLGHIQFEQWKLIRDSGKRAQLLNRLKDGDWNEYHKFLAELAGHKGANAGHCTASPPVSRSPA